MLLVDVRDVTLLSIEFGVSYAPNPSILNTDRNQSYQLSLETVFLFPLPQAPAVHSKLIAYDVDKMLAK